MSSLKSPWKMNKRELIDELGEYEVLIHSSWTVPELRSLVIEQHQARELGGRKNRGMAGITKMTLVQLQEEVRKLELDMPAQPTKRLLMRMIRDAATTENNTRTGTTTRCPAGGPSRRSRRATATRTSAVRQLDHGGVPKARAGRTEGEATLESHGRAPSPCTTRGQQACRSRATARRCSERGREKQLEKEIPSSLIPPMEREDYKRAEATQWEEHLQFGAVRPRFAYRGRAAAQGQGQTLCVGPVGPRPSERHVGGCAHGWSPEHPGLLATQLGLSRHWAAAIGDIRAAFLKVVPAPRNLCLIRTAQARHTFDAARCLDRDPQGCVRPLHQPKTLVAQAVLRAP